MRKLVIIIAAFFAVDSTSSAALAIDKHTDALADARIRKLLRLMDKDKNGTVSKNEFMRYMSQRFDELDVDHSRRLEPDEVQAMNIPNWVFKNASNMPPTKPKIGK